MTRNPEQSNYGDPLEQLNGLFNEVLNIKYRMSEVLPVFVGENEDPGYEVLVSREDGVEMLWLYNPYTQEVSFTYPQESNSADDNIDAIAAIQYDVTLLFKQYDKAVIDQINSLNNEEFPHNKLNTEQTIDNPGQNGLDDGDLTLAA